MPIESLKQRLVSEHQTPIIAPVWIDRLVGLCLCLIVSVGLFDIFFYYYGWLPSEIVSRSFNIAIEDSYGTWIATNISLLTGLVALAIAWREYLGSQGRIALGWLVVGLFFVFVSFDDAAKFHERLGSAIHYQVEDNTGTELATWFPSWGWQLYVAPLFVAMGVYLYGFFWVVLSRRLILWSLLGLAMLAAAVGIDFYEGMLDRENQEAFVHLLHLLEELLEMFGTTVFLFVFLESLAARVQLTVSMIKPQT